jgi:hypothetical protein
MPRFPRLPAARALGPFALAAAVLGTSFLSPTKPASAALSSCLAGEIVDIAPTPSGAGYTLVGSDGGIFSFGDSQFKGSMGGKPLNQPMVAIVPTASGAGYWEVAADGGVFAFGDAVAPASNPLPGMRLNAPVVDAARAGANGLELVASDGGVFSLGGAPNVGSMGGRPLNAPMVDIVVSPSGRGYATVAADGGVFAFGDYQPPANNPLPAMAARGELHSPITAAARHGSGMGLILAGGDGGTFAIGGAPFIGSAAGLTLAKPISGIALDPNGNGQWLSGRDGGVFAYGPGGGFFGNAVSAPSCSAPLPTTTGARIVQIAKDIRDGKAVTPWGGGPVPYTWGGGHGSTAGPSLGTCDGYHGSIQPCPADKTRGVDCSGFTRWVYKLAFGRDVFGGVNSNKQLAAMNRVSSPQPGDLAFFGTSPSNTSHVAIYIGNGRMIEAPYTGLNVRESAVSGHSGLVGYYRL